MVACSVDFFSFIKLEHRLKELGDEKQEEYPNRNTK